MVTCGSYSVVIGKFLSLIMWDCFQTSAKEVFRALERGSVEGTSSLFPGSTL